jgi:hypothetical protein
MLTQFKNNQIPNLRAVNSPKYEKDKEKMWDNNIYDICTFNEKVYKKYRVSHNK